VLEPIDQSETLDIGPYSKVYIGFGGSKLSKLTIGKLAALAEVSTDTLRYYEREGLIAPDSKSDGGYCLYGEDAARRVRFIKQAQHCGFTLVEIRELLTLREQDSACCGDVRKRAVEKKLQLESKIRTMQAMSNALDRLIADCAEEAHPVDECPILTALEHANGSAAYHEN
jgi:DNA-binding transcriptional MerR regulator